MGMFSRDPAKAAAKQEKASIRAQEQADKTLARALDTAEKAKAKAAKKGVATDGALAVGHTFDDSADKFLVVFADRVELVSKGKIGSLLRSGAGTEAIPMSRISSVECKNEGIWSVLEVHTSGNAIKFKGDQVTSPYLRAVILEQMQSNADSPPNQEAGVGGGDVTDQIRKLSDLHQAGILTNDEFESKKAELLKRL